MSMDTISDNTSGCVITNAIAEMVEAARIRALAKGAK